MAPAGKLRIWADNVIWDSGEREPGIADLARHTVDELPNDVLPYLLGSRYCEVDRLGPMAWDLFGKIPPTWERVQAIMDFVHSHITFGYKYARMNKTAWETWYERTGVCRDFQHLAVTFCRALNIPARYATGYLGDIGVPPLPDHPLIKAWRDPNHLAHSRIIINPHSAFYTEEGLIDMRVKGSQNCRRVLLGQTPYNVVN